MPLAGLGVEKPNSPFVGQLDDRNEFSLQGLSRRFVAWEFFWTPSIVPESGDQNIYMVLDGLGRLGRIWPEADAEATELETVITDILTGQYSSPVRVVAFNTAERWWEDVSEDVAYELRRRCDLQMRKLLASICDFVEQHESSDRQQ